MAWRENRYFVNPFKKGGCVPTAWATVSSTPTATFAAALAGSAPCYDKSTGAAYGLYQTRWPDGSTPLSDIVKKWAAIAGVKVIEVFVPVVTFEHQKYIDTWGWDRTRTVVRGEPTLAQFCKTAGAHGRWVVSVRGHAVAVIDGEPFGSYQTRARVECAWRVTDL
jgi:hypothetical protein